MSAFEPVKRKGNSVRKEGERTCGVKVKEDGKDKKKGGKSRGGKNGLRNDLKRKTGHRDG